jgi:hypothetical protein
MSLESDIQALTVAVNRLTEALQNQPTSNTIRQVVFESPSTDGFPTVVPDLPLPAVNAEPPERTSKVTQAELREVAQKLLAQKKLPEILRINREHGIKRITECPEEKYDAVYASLTAALGDAP